MKSANGNDAPPQAVTLTAQEAMAVSGKMIDYQLGGMLKDGMPADMVIDQLIEYLTNILAHIDPPQARTAMTESIVQTLADTVKEKVIKRLGTKLILPGGNLPRMS